MKFTSPTIVAIAYLLQAGVHALPSADPVGEGQDVTPSNVRLLSSEDVTVDGTSGLFEVYVDDDAPDEEEEPEDGNNGLLQRRCGSNRVSCDTEHNLVDRRACGMLMDKLGEEGDLSATPFTSLCFTVTNFPSNNKCCVAWERKKNGLKRKHLLKAAKKTMDTCTNRLVSGAARDVNLNGSCQKQCLSSKSKC